MRGHVRKRRSWEFIVDVGRHPVTGGRRQKSKAGFHTRKEAESALREFIRSVEAGGDPCLERIELASYLGRWLDYQRVRGTRPGPLDAYEGYIRREIVPLLGDIELAELRPHHVRAVQLRMAQRRLSPATIAQVRSILGSARRSRMGSSPRTRSPQSSARGCSAKEPHWPTSSQLGGASSSLAGNRVGDPDPPGHGHRRPPLGDPRYLLVRRRPDLRHGPHPPGVQPVRGTDRSGTVVFTPLKTRRARRLVQLPPFALKRLRRHRREQLRRRTALGPAWRDPYAEQGKPLAMVCDRGDGPPPYPDAFTRAFKRLARQARMHPATRLHDVRHAVATELGRRGVHPVIVSAVLGRFPRVHDRRLPARMAGGTVPGGHGSRGSTGPYARWQSVGTGGSRVVRGSEVRREIAGHRRWGSEPPTDGL